MNERRIALSALATAPPFGLVLDAAGEGRAMGERRIAPGRVAGVPPPGLALRAAGEGVR